MQARAGDARRDLGPSRGYLDLPFIKAPGLIAAMMSG
jgi:hypothetical protein